MNIEECYDQLNNWIKQSNGSFIHIDDRKFSFSKISPFSSDELSEFETNNHIQLPNDYKRFLIEVGAVDIFVGELSVGIEILSPSNIKSFSKSVFDNYGDDLYPEILLTTSIPKFGYLGGFWMNAKSKENDGIFFPEIPPELWIEECDFLSFNDWLIQFIQSRSKDV